MLLDSSFVVFDCLVKQGSDQKMITDKKDEIMVKPRFSFYNACFTSQGIVIFFNMHVYPISQMFPRYDDYKQSMQWLEVVISQNIYELPFSYIVRNKVRGYVFREIPIRIQRNLYMSMEIPNILHCGGNDHYSYNLDGENTFGVRFSITSQFDHTDF